MERERISFNFKELIKSFFGNGEEYAKEDDIDREVNKLEEAQDNAFIKKQVEAVTIVDNKGGGKKSDRINVKAAKKEETVKSIDDRERDEER